MTKIRRRNLACVVFQLNLAKRRGGLMKLAYKKIEHGARVVFAYRYYVTWYFFLRIQFTEFTEFHSFLSLNISFIPLFFFVLLQERGKNAYV